MYIGVLVQDLIIRTIHSDFYFDTSESELGMFFNQMRPFSECNLTDNQFDSILLTLISAFHIKLSEGDIRRFEVVGEGVVYDLMRLSFMCIADGYVPSVHESILSSAIALIRQVGKIDPVEIIKLEIVKLAGLRIQMHDVADFCCIIQAYTTPTGCTAVSDGLSNLIYPYEREFTQT